MREPVVEELKRIGDYLETLCSLVVLYLESAGVKFQDQDSDESEVRPSIPSTPQKYLDRYQKITEKVLDTKNKGGIL